MKSDSPIDRLTKLLVQDLMSTEIRSVYAHQMMPEVANFFLEHDLSAAPVIDETERCVGMLSAKDFLREFLGDDHLFQHSDDKDCWEIVRLPDMACSYMTRAVQTIAPDASISEAAKVMTVEKIHHLPVLNSEGRLAGMLSTMDITRAYARILQTS